MYFKEKEDTNIDDEFNDGNIISKLLNILNKYKLIFIIAAVLILIIILIIIFANKKVTNYLVLDGEEYITIYQDSDYIEPGYAAYNSKNESLNNQVEILTNLDTTTIGEYEITYTLGEITQTRKISVIEKPKEYTYIWLNEGRNIYLKLGEEFKEPGYKVYNSTGIDLTSKVKVTGNVDTSIKGSYQIVYSVINASNVTISETRTVTVMDSEIGLSLESTEYTNDKVTINIKVIDNYFDYLILPNGNKIITSTYAYTVNENGTYKFTSTNTKGITKEESIEVKNIDRTAPTGSCSGKYGNGKTIITINAKDEAGIRKYTIDGKSYMNNKITLYSEKSNVNVTIQDNAGNIKNVSCNLTKDTTQTSTPSSSSNKQPTPNGPSITNITKDGVIITITAKKYDADISGYYFSYNSNMPDENGGYIPTNKTTIDVVRLVGTTYVWVKDTKGKISKPVTITLTGKDYPNTSSGYTVIKGTKLRDALVKKGTTIEEFNKLMSRSVRAAGVGTKEGVATAAATLNGALAYKYGIKIPYWRGGKTNSWGAYAAWGMSRANTTYPNGGYDYYGMDCDGLVNWAYRNGGIIYPQSTYYGWRSTKGIPVSEQNGDIGDVMATEGHVKIIIGKTDKEFIIAEEYGVSVGNIISRHAFTNTKNYTIISADLIIKTVGKESRSVFDKMMPLF